MIYKSVKQKDIMEIQTPFDVALRKLKNRAKNNGNVLLSNILPKTIYLIAYNQL